MIKIAKAIVILLTAFFVLAEQISNYKEKRTKTTITFLILACVMFVSAIIITIGYWV